MQLDRVLKFKRGRKVKCPPLGGLPGYEANVMEVQKDNLFFNAHGVEYVWVKVMKACGSVALWPSHLLKQP